MLHWNDKETHPSTVHLGACIPNFIIQETFPYRDAATYGLVQETYESRIENGYLIVPETPGLGIVLDEDAIARYPCIRID